MAVFVAWLAVGSLDRWNVARDLADSTVGELEKACKETKAGNVVDISGLVKKLKEAAANLKFAHEDIETAYLKRRSIFFAAMVIDTISLLTIRSLWVKTCANTNEGGMLIRDVIGLAIGLTVFFHVSYNPLFKMFAQMELIIGNGSVIDRVGRMVQILEGYQKRSMKESKTSS